MRQSDDDRLYLKGLPALVLEMAAEAGLHFDRHARWNRIGHAGVTLSVRGKPDRNGPRLCRPRPELARCLGARIT